MIRRLNLFGNPNIGVYAIATEKYVIVPRKLLKRTKKAIERVLEVSVMSTDIGQSRIVGVLIAANSNGICVPSYTMESEIQFLKQELGIPIEKIPTELTALGNNILCNDKKALVNPEFEQVSQKVISDILGVEVVSGKIAEWTTVGSSSVATNKGILLPNTCDKEEIQLIQELFGIPASIGTINSGDPLVGSGLIANSNGALAGILSTGPELARVGMALEL
ncbi:MAG: translation initiation factor IF-6 [Promethearchaeota archaeon]